MTQKFRLSDQERDQISALIETAVGSITESDGMRFYANTPRGLMDVVPACYHDAALSTRVAQVEELRRDNEKLAERVHTLWIGLTVNVIVLLSTLAVLWGQS